MQKLLRGIARWLLGATIVAAVSYVGAFLLLRTVVAHGGDGVTFSYPGASRWYATSIEAAKKIVVMRKLHNDPSFRDGQLYDYGDAWQYCTWRSNPRQLWRMFGPLERLEILLRGRTPRALSPDELAEFEGTR